jgi:hypothetical protein
MRFLSAFAVCLFATATATAQNPAAPEKLPRAAVDPISVRVEGEVGPEQAVVAGKLVEVFFETYPKVLARFDDPAKPAPRRITIEFKKGIKVPAYCAGTTVTVSTEWLAKHPDDVGLLTHELTHAVQHYPKGDPGWITEGIADYARFKFGPKEQPGWKLPEKLGAKHKYTDSYRVSARFFVWLDETYPGSVDKVHRAMQAGKYDEGDWKAITGRDLETLWVECVRSFQK